MNTDRIAIKYPKGMNLFRDLTSAEKVAFKKWAQENYQPFTPIDGCWHPIIQAECVRININSKVNL